MTVRTSPSGVATLPLPRQDGQTSWRVTTTCRWTPLIDSRNVTDSVRGDPPRLPAGRVTGTNRVQDLGEQLVNVAACAPCAATEKSKPANSNVAPADCSPAPSRRRRTARARRVRERLVRLRDALKQGFSRTVSRVDAGMVPPRQAAVRRLMSAIDAPGASPRRA